MTVRHLDWLLGVRLSERLIETAMFLAPFVVFLAWRLMPAAIMPSPALAGLALGLVLVVLGCLLWQHQSDAGSAGHGYVPAHMQDGRIVAGHAAPE